MRQYHHRCAVIRYSAYCIAAHVHESYLVLSVVCLPRTAVCDEQLKLHQERVRRARTKGENIMKWDVDTVEMSMILRDPTLQMRCTWCKISPDANAP